jgi:catechol 2,3-dioxygenase-like lactoylglutathione lyase family enzyme
MWCVSRPCPRCTRRKLREAGRSSTVFEAPSQTPRGANRRSLHLTRKPIKFAHAVYRTRRFEEMIGWYETVFGATVQHENPALAFLTYDDEHHRFAFLNLAVIDPDGAPEADRRGKVGVDHLGYTNASVGDLLENYAELKGGGAPESDLLVRKVHEPVSPIRGFAGAP